MDRVVFNIVEKPAKNIRDICVGPLVSDDEMVGAVSLLKSFGYDCSKFYNLCAIDNTAVYTSGNVIHFLDIKTGTLRLQRSIRCTGIGHITANLVNSHLAIGEKGEKPGIYIVSWPKLDVVSTLTSGTEKSYVFLDYNFDGQILCSLGGSPDHTIALWDWRKSTMLIKCEASSRPVFKAAFSKLQPEVIVSGGEGHIKFWRTAKTFTGMKLTGENGKFGATEMSDVVGFEFLEDGKVASGCDWGNILLWANNTLSLELTTRRQVTCHQTPAFAFHRHGSWLISIGTDGWVRAWDLKNLTPTEENGLLFCKQEAVVYFTVGDHSSILSKVELPSARNELEWLLQDQLGAIWLMDVGPTLDGTEQAPSKCEKLINCQSGKIISMAVCHFGPFVATLGPNGSLLIHNYLTGDIAERAFEMEATALNWIDQLEPRGKDYTIVVGFENGALSLCRVSWKPGRISELQGLRTHNQKVLQLQTNSSAELVASAGEDLAIFLIKLVDMKAMEPIGFVAVDNAPLSIHWSSAESLLVCHLDGTLSEFNVADKLINFKNPGQSYKIDLIPVFQLRGQDIFCDFKNQKDFHLIHCEVWTKNEVVMFLKGKDYQLKCVSFDLESSSVEEICDLNPKLDVCSVSVSRDKSSCLFGFTSGEVQFNTTSADDTWSRFWRLRMHESDRGCQVSGVAFSFDGSFFFSAGFDGSLFMYRAANKTQTPRSISGSSGDERGEEVARKLKGIPAKNCTKSVEEIRAEKAAKRFSSAVEAEKEKLLSDLSKLKHDYDKLKQETGNTLEIDVIKGHRYLEKFFADKIQLLRHDLLSPVVPHVEHCRFEWTKIRDCFMGSIHMTSLRVRGISDDCSVESYLVAAPGNELQEISVPPVEPSLLSLPPKAASDLRRKSEISVKFASGLLEIEAVDVSSFRQQRKSVSTASQLAEKLRSRQAKRNSDNQKLTELMKNKPKRMTKNLKLSEAAMGVYKLKTEKDYHVPDEDRIGSESVIEDLRSTKNKLFDIRMRFNKKIVYLKKERKTIIKGIIEDEDLTALENEAREQKENFDDYLFRLCCSLELYGGLNQAENEKCVPKSAEQTLELVSQFDAKVQSLIEERLKTDVSVCLLKQWYFCTHQKLDIVLSTEATQKQLTGSLKDAEELKQSLEENMLELQQGLLECRGEIELLESQAAKIEADLCAEIDGSVFYEHLLLLYKKEYRPPSLSISSSVTEGSDEVRSGTSSAGSNFKNVSEKVCPAGCDPEMFDFVNHCRLLRYELELKLMERRRILNLMVKDEDVLKKKIKLADKNIISIVKNIDAFYRDRQAKINELEIAIPLKLHQIPAGEDFSECVLISMKTMEDLANRSGELQDEAADLDLRFQSDMGILKEIKSQTNVIEEDIIETQRKIDTTMIQRFGKIVNTPELESAILSCEIENFTRPSFSNVDEATINEIKGLESEVNEATRQIALETETKKKNAKLLAGLLKELNQINGRSEQSKHKNCSREEAEARRAQIKRLNELVVTQREQMSAIKYELELLRCKVASSRDLFYSDADSSSGPPSEEVVVVHRRRKPTPRRPRVLTRTVSESTPEILIEHCESEVSDTDDAETAEK